jgi:hypothetical protein
LISNFIPEIWSSQILVQLRKALVYGAVCNRDYEGEIAVAGDTVHITNFSDPTVRDYTPESNITVDSITDDTRALTVDQKKYFAFDVDDVNRRQALPGWVAEVTSRGAYKLLDTVDSFLAGAMYDGVNGTANDIGGITADVSDNTGYGLVLVALRTALNRANVPKSGRWIVLPPELAAAFLQDNRFINAAASGDQSNVALRDGAIGRALGFDIYESNNVPTETVGVYSVIAGHPMATTFAEQILETEAVRRELRFGDLVKALHVYGAKVVRPEALALASVTVQA